MHTGSSIFWGQSGGPGLRRRIVSLHRMYRPEATTIAEPRSSCGIGTSPQIANPRIVAQPATGN